MAWVMQFSPFFTGCKLWFPFPLLMHLFGILPLEAAEEEEEEEELLVAMEEFNS